MCSRYSCGSSYIQRATGSVPKARTSLAMARSISQAPAMVATVPWRSGVCCMVQDPSSIRQLRQIFIDRPEFFITHSSDRPPRHLLTDSMAVGINPGAHGGDELLNLPALYTFRFGPNRPDLPGPP